jgi:hypothetical protein
VLLIGPFDKRVSGTGLIDATSNDGCCAAWLRDRAGMVATSVIKAIPIFLKQVNRLMRPP